MDISAAQFRAALEPLRSATRAAQYQTSFQAFPGGYGEGDTFIGVAMGEVFALAKTFRDLPPGEIEVLLESPLHEVRVGGVSVMDFQARQKITSAARRKDLFELYLRRHDRINNWDLVDRAAPYVIGGYLFDKPRDVLYDLARSPNVWERRTAITSTYYFIREGQLEDTFALAETLLKDEHDLIHKAVGGWLREAGKQDRRSLLSFLDTYATTMPRTMLRYATEHLEKDQRERYAKAKGS